MRDDDTMLVDTLEKDETVEAIWRDKGKGKGGKGKSKGKSGGKVAARPSTSSSSSAPGAQEGWWMRPCRYCQGRHMDALCPTIRPVVAPRPP
eukprot:13054442-Heterocapsa_arctica.AAC.1